MEWPPYALKRGDAGMLGCCAVVENAKLRLSIMAQ